METTFAGVLVGILATMQIVEVWHHGEIFAERRALLENRTDFWARALNCPFCLSVWVGIAVVVTMSLSLPENVFGNLAIGAVKLFVAGLAFSRGANLLNDLTHAWSRTPKPIIPLEPDPDDKPNGPYWITVVDDADFKEEKSYALRDDWLESLESELAEIGASHDEKLAAMRHAVSMWGKKSEQAEVEGDVGRLWFGVHPEKP